MVANPMPTQSGGHGTRQIPQSMIDAAERHLGGAPGRIEFHNSATHPIDIGAALGETVCHTQRRTMTHRLLAAPSCCETIQVRIPPVQSAAKLAPCPMNEPTIHEEMLGRLTWDAGRGFWV